MSRELRLRQVLRYGGPAREGVKSSAVMQFSGARDVREAESETEKQNQFSKKPAQCFGNESRSATLWCGGLFEERLPARN
jgi:hypothetical protein